MPPTLSNNRGANGLANDLWLYRLLANGLQPLDRRPHLDKQMLKRIVTQMRPHNGAVQAVSCVWLYGSHVSIG
jgi:hypothetical protein